MVPGQPAMRSAVRERPVVWRVAVFAAVAAIVAWALIARSPLPGFAAALFALAVPLAVAGWALWATGDRSRAVPRDAFLGVALGIVLCALSLLVW
jgi:hypothetical protein